MEDALPLQAIVGAPPVVPTGIGRHFSDGGFLRDLATEPYDVEPVYGLVVETGAGRLAGKYSDCPVIAPCDYDDRNVSAAQARRPEF
jgi:hypothetical protein